MDLRERRRFVVAAATALLAAPRVGFPQQGPKVWRVGYLASSAAGSGINLAPWLAELGYRDGENIRLEYRFPAGKDNLLPLHKLPRRFPSS
jgi:hypothetical protein